MALVFLLNFCFILVLYKANRNRNETDFYRNYNFAVLFVILEL